MLIGLRDLIFFIIDLLGALPSSRRGPDKPLMTRRDKWLIAGALLVMLGVFWAVLASCIAALSAPHSAEARGSIWFVGGVAAVCGLLSLGCFFLASQA